MASSAVKFFPAIILYENELYFPIQITFFCHQSEARKEIFLLGILSTASNGVFRQFHQIEIECKLFFVFTTKFIATLC